MGSFIGHAIPGAFFIIVALWWTVQMFRRYYESLRKTGAPYISTPTWKVHLGRFGHTDIEAKLVVIFSAIGIIVELVAAPIFRGTGVGSNNAQHGTMYFFFGLVGLLRLILPRLRIFPNHESIVYCTLVLAFAVEGLLFKFHLFGRDDFDVMLHTLLLYAIYGCVIMTLVELRFRKNVLCALGRAFFTLLQGTWFFHAAMALYPPFTDPWGHSKNMTHMEGGGDIDHGMDMGNHDAPTDHHAIMMVVMAYTWHMSTNLMIMLVLGGVIGCCYKRKWRLG